LVEPLFQDQELSRGVECDCDLAVLRFDSRDEIGTLHPMVITRSLPFVFTQTLGLALQLNTKSLVGTNDAVERDQARKFGAREALHELVARRGLQLEFGGAHVAVVMPLLIVLPERRVRGLGDENHALPSPEAAQNTR